MSDAYEHAKAQLKTAVSKAFGVPEHIVTSDAACDQLLIAPNNETRPCQRVHAHPGLHRWQNEGDEPDLIWTDDGILFYGPPYPGDTCATKWVDAGDATFQCCRPKGHIGSHGNPNGEGPDVATFWMNDAGLPAALAPVGTWHSDGDIWESDDAAFDIVISPNAKAVGRKIRLNGLELPNVRKMSVRYEPGDARTVILEILATNIREVEQ